MVLKSYVGFISFQNHLCETSIVFEKLPRIILEYYLKWMKMEKSFSYLCSKKLFLFLIYSEEFITQASKYPKNIFKNFVASTPSSYITNSDNPQNRVRWRSQANVIFLAAHFLCPPLPKTLKLPSFTGPEAKHVRQAKHWCFPFCDRCISLHYMQSGTLVPYWY